MKPFLSKDKILCSRSVDKAQDQNNNETFEVFSSEKKNKANGQKRSLSNKTNLTNRKFEIRSSSVKKPHTVSFKDNYELKRSLNDPNQNPFIQDQSNTLEPLINIDDSAQYNQGSKKLKPIFNSSIASKPKYGPKYSQGSSPLNNSDPRYEKMALKIRSQAKRIIQLERENQRLQEEVEHYDQEIQRRDRSPVLRQVPPSPQPKPALRSPNRSRAGSRGSRISKNEDLADQNRRDSKSQLSQKNMVIENLRIDNINHQKENRLLKQKISLLEKSVQKSKEINFNLPQQPRQQIMNDLEFRNMELEEVLKQETLKNEALESMNSLLRKLSEEKLEKLGYQSSGNLSKLETLLEAKEVFQENEQLIEELDECQQSELGKTKELKVMSGVISHLKSKIQQMAQSSIQFEQRILQLHQNETSYINQVLNYQICFNHVIGFQLGG